MEYIIGKNGDSIFINKLTQEEIKPKQEVTIEPVSATKFTKNIPYKDLLDMKYKEIISYLLGKYGPVPGDYFANETCRSKNRKITRTKEGLFIHHIDEDKAIMLSTDGFAINNSYRYQKADRLVYCNILEHLILHVKIAEEPRNVNANKDELPGIGGAVNFLCIQINDCYSDYEFKQPMMITIREMIKDDFDSYILIMKRLINAINNNPLYAMAVNPKSLYTGYGCGINKRVKNALNL